MANPNKFRFSIDRGGTFTDIYAEAPAKNGCAPEIVVLKLLSEDPANYADAPREGIRRVLSQITGNTYPAHSFSAEEIEWIRMGTTVATNALLERKGEPTLLVTTRGMGDVLRIGRQSRPRIFDLRINLPETLFCKVVEADERVALWHEDLGSAALGQRVQGVNGEVLRVLKPLDTAALRKALGQVRQQGIKAVAIVFMHAYAWPKHEQQAQTLANELGFEQVSVSHQVSPAVKLVDRGNTTCVDAYLTPHIQRYLSSFRQGFSCGLAQTKLLFMQSHGGLIDATRFHGSRAILSGPAGGVVGYARTGYQPNNPRPLIGFDMGGTSTDVSRYHGQFELAYENETAGVRIQAPQMHIVTVAAGGGSRLFYRNGMFQVGPESAGAHPGPACYRKGGHLAITDANVLLGRLLPQYFPKIFGPNADEALDVEGARQAMAKVTEAVNVVRHQQDLNAYTPEETAQGFVDAANESMVRPIREVSVARGYDVKDHVLACFGGAGGQHACAVARTLGIKEIFIQRYAGLLSAYGMGKADVVRDLRASAAGQVLDDKTLARLEDRFSQLENQGREQLEEDGLDPAHIVCKRRLNLRYAGSVHAMMIECPEDENYAEHFRQTHLRESGFVSDTPILVDDLEVSVIGSIETLQAQALPPNNTPAKPVEYAQIYLEGAWQKSAVYLYHQLQAGQSIQGPALVLQDGSSILLETDCQLKVNAYGDLRIFVHARNQQQTKQIGSHQDPVQLSIFNNLFMSIAEQMGKVLQRTAVSTNIKERLDFSCAIFDDTGGLVANAPHIPVHLGAMSETVRTQWNLRKGQLKQGDVLVTNDPQMGGSHLPDITVITPIIQHGDALFFVANRGHHAEIGGITPGSVPPFSRILAEEGACIHSHFLVKEGRFQEEEMREILAAPAKTPRALGEAPVFGSRKPQDNIADLKAQVASNQKGVVLLLEMVERYGLEVVQAYMRHIQANAAQAVRNLTKSTLQTKGLGKKGQLKAVESMDDGSVIPVCITLDAISGDLTIDFDGVSPQALANHNAPRAVVASAVIYVLRTLIDQDIPMNGGFLEPVNIRIPHPSMLSPSPEAAVVAGNVETSSRITDVLLKAFGAVAGAQGTMNNLTFGNEHLGYYETIGGGSGAGPTWHGKSAIHAHMSNTRITDAEVLERRYPVLVRAFSLRPQSGGEGTYRGGDGAIRDIEFLIPMQVAIVSERRVFAPYGLAGGDSGKTGQNTLIRKNGQVINLGGRNQVYVAAGDRIRIETPGGGGYGIVPKSPRIKHE